MTPDQERQLNALERQTDALYKLVIKGEEGELPLKAQVDKISKQISQIKNIVWGILIGIVIGGLLFFGLSLKDVIQLLK